MVTVAETIPGYEAQGRIDLTVPAGTPRPIPDRMSKLMVDSAAELALRSVLGLDRGDPAAVSG